MRYLTAPEVELIRRMRADGHSILYVAEIVGCDPKTVRRYAPGHIGKVPVTPLREAFLASPMTAADVARELGWWERGRKADSSRVKRTLGLLPDLNGRGARSRRTLADIETVQLIAEAIGISPFAVLPDDESVATA